MTTTNGRRFATNLSTQWGYPGNRRFLYRHRTTLPADWGTPPRSVTEMKRTKEIGRVINCGNGVSGGIKRT